MLRLSDGKKHRSSLYAQKKIDKMVVQYQDMKVIAKSTINVYKVYCGPNVQFGTNVTIDYMGRTDYDT